MVQPFSLNILFAYHVRIQAVYDVGGHLVLSFCQARYEAKHVSAGVCGTHARVLPDRHAPWLNLCAHILLVTVAIPIVPMEALRHVSIYTEFQGIVAVHLYRNQGQIGPARASVMQVHVHLPSQTGRPIFGIPPPTPCPKCSHLTADDQH